MPYPDIDILNSLVGRIFRVDDVTSGGNSHGWVARYRGSLYGEDSAGAYDELADAVKAFGLTPLFRTEKGRQVIYLAPTRPSPKSSRISINILLFAATVLSVLFVGAQPGGDPPADAGGYALWFMGAMLAGWPYAVSLISILLAHEFGHYLMSRHHKTAATLPYFIPLPVPPLGTMGAAIMMQGTPKNRRVLFDIGVAGPIAGMLIAVPVIVLGLNLSQLGKIVPVLGEVNIEGNSLLYLALKYLRFQQLLPAPASLNGIPPLLYWLKYFFTAQPVPLGATDVFVSPVAFAGWAGLLVTALNLIPAGTLDGGHVVYAIFGPSAKRAFPFIFAALMGLGFFWNGWWVWALMLLLLGRRNVEPLDQITVLDRWRKWLAVLVLIIFIITFMPVPYSTWTGL